MAQGVFMHGDRLSNRIALTFDACPTSQTQQYDERITDILKKHQVPTTLFVSGQWAEQNPQVLEDLMAVPFFEIGLHGQAHPRLNLANQEEVLAEIQDGKAALSALGIQIVPFFRPPYWDHPDSLPRASAQAGSIAVIGDVALGDPSPTRTAQAMQRDAIQWIQGGSIVVLHINGKGVHTAEAIDQLIPELKERGYEFAKVSDLAKDCGFYSADKGLLRQPVGTWSWGSAKRSAQVPFIRIEQTNKGITIQVKHALFNRFDKQATQVNYDGESLSFSYWYEPLNRSASCQLAWNGQLLEGKCEGEVASGEWGVLDTHLWPYD